MHKVTWNYSELPKGYYSAYVTRWGDKWVFRAIPSIGSCCTECLTDTREELDERIEAFLTGPRPAPGFYSAAF